MNEQASIKQLTEKVDRLTVIVSNIINHLEDKHGDPFTKILNWYEPVP